MYEVTGVVNVASSFLTPRTSQFAFLTKDLCRLLRVVQVVVNEEMSPLTIWFNATSIMVFESIVRHLADELVVSTALTRARLNRHLSTPGRASLFLGSRYVLTTLRWDCTAKGYCVIFFGYDLGCRSLAVFDNRFTGFAFAIR